MKIILPISLICSSTTFYLYKKKNESVKCSSLIPKRMDKSFINEQSEKLIKQSMIKSNCPGVSIAVWVDGKAVWSKGFGLADVENNIPCTPETVMRIASISKSLTAVAIAELVENGKVDLDLPVQNYVPTWPDKHFDGKPVIITTRQLLSMLGGIRHYDKSCSEIKPDTNKGKKKGGDGKEKEFYMKKYFQSVTKSLDVFKDDDLCCLPGTKYLYSTYSYTLVSAVIEGATKQKFSSVMIDLFKRIGMKNTFMDENQPIIYNRARYYQLDSNSKLVNAPYVDNSNKWAGGGMLSTVNDLCQMGTALLYSYQFKPIRLSDPLNLSTNKVDTSSMPVPFLKPETMKMLWQPVSNTKCAWDSEGGYAMGWASIAQNEGKAYCRNTRAYYSHTGGAVGASSVLLILPREEKGAFTVDWKKNADVSEGKSDYSDYNARGVVVALLTNMQGVGLNGTALEIAKLFEQME